MDLSSLGGGAGGGAGESSFASSTSGNSFGSGGGFSESTIALIGIAALVVFGLVLAIVTVKSK